MQNWHNNQCQGKIKIYWIALETHKPNKNIQQTNPADPKMPPTESADKIPAVEQ